MSALRLTSAALLAAGAAASVAERVASGAEASGLQAAFGEVGSISFRLGGRPGYQAVNWTTSELKLPAALVRQVCGPIVSEATFAYSLNERWEHGRSTSAEGEQCGAAFTGGHWDPTAACSSESGNPACEVCNTDGDYKCGKETFQAAPDASGSGAYRFLNANACELGDLSGMSGELAAQAREVCPEDQSSKCEEWARHGQCKDRPEFLEILCPRACGTCTDAPHVKVPALSGDDAGLAQMSTPFGVVSRESVTGSGIGLNCDASGPPPVHGTNCRCLEYNGKRSPSVGTITVFKPWDHETFYLGGPGLEALKGRSVVVQCGASFGDKQGRPLVCAALQ